MRYVTDADSDLQPLPAEAEPASAPASSSVVPTNFANASPFQKKTEKKDPANLAVLILGIVALLCSLAAIVTVLGMRPPMLGGPWGKSHLRPCTSPARRIGAVAADPQAQSWQQIAPVSLVETVTGKPPRQGTELRAAVDGNDLRVLFDCVDVDPWATLSKRDDMLFTEEVVEVFLDPVGDLECYFEFEVNPLNTVMDLVLRKSPSGLRKDFAWQCAGLPVTAARRTARGWAADLAIPLESLMPGSAHRQAWRCNFYRIDRPKGDPNPELSAWSPTGLPQFHMTERFGYVIFAD